MRDTILAALRAGDLDGALRQAEQWREAAPSADSWLALAMVQRRRGDIAAAEHALDQALALAPERADLHVLRGQIGLGRGAVEASRESLQQALALDPNQLGAYVLLGHLALAARNLDEAREHLARARRVSAEHPQTLVLEAQVAQAEGQDDRVIPLLTRAVERQPDDALAHSTLGLAFLRRGHFAFATAALRRAIALSPNAGHLRVALVVALERQGLWDEALAELSAMPGFATDRSLRLRHAAVQAQAGQTADALAACARLVDEQPADSAPVRLAESMLAATDPSGRAPWLDALLARHPASAALWEARLRSAAGEEVPTLLERWQAADAGSPALRQAQARWAEAQGQVDEAIAHAEAALAGDARLAMAQDLWLRHMLGRDPAAVVARTEALLAQQPVLLPVAGLHGTRALALDRLDRINDALDAWAAGWRSSPAGFAALPKPVPAAEAVAPDEPLRGTLLWGGPGSGVEWVVQWLGNVAGVPVTVDRLQDDRRADGFGAFRPQPGDPAVGSAARWQAAWAATGASPDAAVDWLPHWDGWTHATLAGTRLIVALRDPRDLLLNWIAGQASTVYRMPAIPLATEWLAAVLQQLADVLAGDDGRCVVLRLDQLGQAPEAVVDALHAAVDRPALAEPMPPTAAGWLAEGRWRAYREPLGPAFDRLRDVAVALGYPAD